MEVTPRSLQLFDVLRHHSARTRFILVVLNVFSVILFAALLNEKIGGTRPRMDVRFWSTRLDGLECEWRGVRCPEHLSADVVSLFAGVDSAELEILREAQLSRFETVTIPILGVDVSATDVSVLAALALLILFIWFKLAIAQERRALELLIYPLDAKENDGAARFYWGLPRQLPHTPEERKDWLSKRLSEYRNDIIILREAISSQFLFMYLFNTKKRKKREKKGGDQPAQPAGEAAGPVDQQSQPTGEAVAPGSQVARPDGEAVAPGDQRARPAKEAAAAGRLSERLGEFLESVLSRALLMLPVILLSICIRVDFYWDFEKVFKETGRTYIAEIVWYAERLDSVANAVADSVTDDHPLYPKLKAAEHDLRSDRKWLKRKRDASVAFLVVTILLGIWIWYDTNRMSDAVRAMYSAAQVPTPPFEPPEEKQPEDQDPPKGPDAGASGGSTAT